MSDALAELIISGTLKSGQHLVESELAEQLGVSRQPVREALQRLHTDGWVDLRPAQGAFVHTPTQEEATQLLDVRTVLETYSAQLAAQHAKPEHIERLRQLQQEGVDALAESTTDRLVAANTALHTYITSVGGNDVLAELIAQVGRKVRWYYTPIANSRSKGSWNEHARLIEAIAKGDPERAARSCASTPSAPAPTAKPSQPRPRTPDRRRSARSRKRIAPARPVRGAPRRTR